MRASTCAAVMLAGALAACAEAPPAQEAATDSTAPAPVVHLPQEIRRNVCPFECCVYGNWSARTPIVVHDAEGDTSRAAFTLAAGDTFAAITGNVHLNPIGRVVVTQNVRTDGSDNIEVLAGDTIDVLDYQGEGFFSIRYRGQVVTSKAFWAEPGARFSMFGDTMISGTLLRAPVSTWWVQVRERGGRTGWIRMDSTVRVGGADACGQ